MSCWPDYTPSRRERFRRWINRRFGKQIIIPKEYADALKASNAGLFNPRPDLYALHLKAMDQIAREGFSGEWLFDPIVPKSTISQRIVDRFWRIVEWF